MKKLENQTVFQCSYCSRISKSAAGIYRHEMFCKKNPHNQLLCASCIHCQREVHFSEVGEKCEGCGYGNYFEECFHFGKICDAKILYVDFICAIDGSKMYAPNKIRHKTCFKEIKERCDKPMVDATQECKNYKFKGL